MAYDRYDPRHPPRDEGSRWRDERSQGGNRDRPDYGRDHDRRPGGERGFFERAGDEIASWFGSEDEDHRQRHQRPDPSERERFSRERSWGRSERDRDDDRSPRASWGSRDRERDRGRDDYRPMTGDYGRSEQGFAATGIPRSRFGRDDDYRSPPPQRQWSRDDSQPGRSPHDDPHYSSLRQRQMSELDRDYDDYRREHQAKFEDDFGNWRQRRQQKRGLLGQVREQMEVVGSDDQHVGTIDRVAGDRIILTKSDPAAGDMHHSLGCTDIDRVEGERIILDCTADDARKRWRNEDRSRALFEREDQGESGPHILERSFEGTYR